MTHTNKDFKNEKFRTRLISDDETQYVDTDYTIGEFEEMTAEPKKTSVRASRKKPTPSRRPRP